ncbi:hypothetical protein RFI_18732, partial [Reticulomyxa filosa]
MKQLLVAVNILAKEKPPHFSVFEVLKHNLGVFDTINASVSHNSKNKSRCTPFEKFMIIPCFNFLTLTKQGSGHKELPSCWSIQNIDFGSEEKHSIDEATLAKVLILDLHLRKNNEFSPAIRIEKHLINLLYFNNQFIDFIVELLLDNTKFDKTTKTNLWEYLWSFEKCWSIFWSLYELHFNKWDTFIGKIQECVENFTNISKKLFKGFTSNDFISRVMESPSNVHQFFLFVKRQSSMYVFHCSKQKKSLCVYLSFFFTIKLFCDNNEMEGQGLIVMLELLRTRIADNEDTNEKITLTNNILRLLLRDKENRLLWITLLANSHSISTPDVFSKSLQESFKKWLNDKNEEEEEEEEEGFFERVSFHSKVLELVSSDTFANAKLYHQYLIESVNDKYNELWLNNKKWTSEEINMCAKVNWELWPQVIKNIDNIPKIEDLDKKDVESVSEKLCSSLDYCFGCRLWFEYKSPMQTKLSTFFGKVLTKLGTSYKLLSIHIHKYLIQHRKVIEDIFSHCPKDLKSSLQTLDKITNDYTQFSELIDLFKEIQDYLFEHDLSDRLKELKQQSDDWEAQGFIRVKESYKDELQLLKLYEQKMKEISERKESSMFQKMWEHFNSQYKSSQHQTSFSIFDKVFDDTKSMWKNFKQNLQNQTLKYQDLVWVFGGNPNDTDGIIKNLTGDMQYLFKEYNSEQRQAIVNDVEIKMKKEINLKEQLQSWIELKNVTEQMKECHPRKDSIQEDKKWQKYVKALARMEQVTRTKEDISITETSQCYDACIECVDKSSKLCVEIGLFDTLIKCKDQIKILAENENFNNNAHFKNTLNILTKSKLQRDQDLVAPLRHVNNTMKEKLWTYTLEDMTNLAKSILALHSDGQDFVINIKKCSDTDLNTISNLVNEADNTRTAKSLKQLKDAIRYGKWQFASCKEVLEGKKEKELTLNINNVTCSYQIKFWKKGGRIDIEKDEKGGTQNSKGSLELSVSLQMNEFEDSKKIWKQRLIEWNKQCFELREQFPALNYFCFNQVHFLFQKINQLNMPNCPDRFIQASKYVKPFLQKINCQVTDKDVNDILQKWKDSKDFTWNDAENNDNSNSFKKCRDSIAKFGHILNPLWNLSRHNFVSEKSISIGLHPGKPNLVIGSNERLFELLGLFEFQHFIPRAEHILICNETTTEEDIACLIFRAITNDKRMPLTTTETNRNSVKPLYCLVYPEKLTLATLDQICQDIYELLLSDIRLEHLKNCFYMFTVLSFNKTNALCKILAPFRVTLQGLSFQHLPNQMLSKLYRNQWTNNRAHDISTEPPWIQLYTSERVAMGKSRLIQRDIQRIREIHKTKTVHEICITFNSKDIDWIKIMDRFWSYHPCSNEMKNMDIGEGNTLIIYHLDISSCVSNRINNFLFELLFLQHINSNSQMSQCFHVNSNMIFLIEIPSTFDRSSPTLSFKQFFYLFFSTVQFPTIQVSSQDNEFEFEKEAQYAIKWMQEFYNGNLKLQQDIDPDTMPDFETNRMKTFMKKHFNAIAKSNPVHQCSFFKYLNQQFKPLAKSLLLKNKFSNADARSVQWRYDITKSVLEMAEILCCRQYNQIKSNPKEKEKKIESTGQEEFFLCKKWRGSKKCCYLVNQNGENISVLINDIKNVNRRQLDDFQKLKFYLFDWQQDLKNRELVFQVLYIAFYFNCSIFTFPITKKKKKKITNKIIELKTEEPTPQTEKEERLRLLLHILGTPNQGIMKEYEEKKMEAAESLHNQIVNKLCNDKEWSNYVLTFDNILKMVAIFMKIRTNTPVILMGETGCGKTSLIKYLALTANVQLIPVDVHGGFGRQEIRQVMEDCDARLLKEKESKTEMWVFLDEVNTSPDIGWFKELICDHRLDGVKISDQIKIIAACNPYRPRKVQTSDITNKNDPLSKWMYRVVPLCDTMKEYQYIQAMTKQIKCKFDKNTVVYKKMQQWEFKI